jgi:GNAT superfamily N-acetyltransferase
MKLKYKIYQNDKGDFSQYFYLFKKAFPYSKQQICKKNSYQEYLFWLYEKNPLGSVVGFDAYSNDILVGHYACVPVHWKLGSKTYKSLLSLNTAVDPNFQGQGIFTKLALKTYDLAQKLDYDFVYGISNQNSTHGFYKLGFEILGPLHMQLSIPWFEINKPNNIIQEGLSNQLACEFLKWRLNRPFTNYRCKGSRIISNPEMLPISFISKKITNDTSVVKQTFKFRSPLKLYIGTSKQPGFITLPKWIRPVPLNLIVKCLNPSSEILKSIENWDLDYLDFDLA